MITTQPANLQKSLDRILDVGERDVERASLIRQTLKGDKRKKS
jgi:protein-arginine kinase